jgi:hypothetical protein
MHHGETSVGAAPLAILTYSPLEPGVAPRLIHNRLMSPSHHGPRDRPRQNLDEK